MTEPPAGWRSQPGESDEQKQERITKEIQFAQQRVIIEVLQEWHDRPVHEIEVVLRKVMEGAGLPVPPPPWIRGVAGEIAEDRLYVVAKDAIPANYFENESARRAQDRVTQHGLSSAEEDDGAADQRNNESVRGFELPPTDE